MKLYLKYTGFWFEHLSEHAIIAKNNTSQKHVLELKQLLKTVSRVERGKYIAHRDIGT